MTGRAIPDETKVAALADLVRGHSVTQVASRYHLDRKTVYRWRSEDPELAPRFRQDIKEDVSEAVAALLKTQLSTLVAQLAVVSDPEWLKTQSAQGLAILHGVIADKTVRILESIAPDAPEDEEGE